MKKPILGKKLGSIWYVHRTQGMPFKEAFAMWAEAKKTARVGEVNFLGIKESVSTEFFTLLAHKNYEEATNWYCVEGCCTVIWGTGKRGNMGGYGPAGCPCDNLADPRDLKRGPIPK